MNGFNILIFCSSTEDYSLIEGHLRKVDVKPNFSLVTNEHEFESALSKQIFDVILLALEDAGNDAPAFIATVKRHQLTTPIIIISDQYKGGETIVNLIKLGVKDFIIKSDLESLVPTIQKFIEKAKIYAQIKEQAEDKSNKYRLIFENSPIGIVILSLDGNFLDVNPAFCQMLGYSREELIGKHFISITHPDDVYKSKEFTEEIQSGKKSEGFLEKRYIRKNGDIMWGLLTIKLLKDDNGNPKYLITQLKDITERKQREAKLLFQANIIDSVSAAIIVLDQFCKIEFWNKSAEKILGYTAEEVLGKNVNDLSLFEKENCDKIISDLESNKNIEYEIRGFTKSGETKIFDLQLSIYKTHDDSLNNKAIIMLIDITEKKLLEESLLQAQRINTLGMLAGGVAHDLNNCLTPIKMGVEMLSELVTDENSSKILSQIEKSIGKSISIVKQVLTYGRQTTDERVPINMNFLISELSNIIKITFPSNIKLVIKKDSNLWDIWGNRTRLHQAILNLCINSRDAMQQGGTLTIKTANIELNGEKIKSIPNLKPGMYVMIEVSDTGCGIPLEFLNKIFTPYFTTKESGKGTGLGLFIVKTVVEEHNGFMQVSSRPSEGTTFSMYFPAEIKRLSKEEHFEKLKSLPRGNGETILLVDDNESVRIICRELLESYGYKVCEAVDGVDAIGVFMRNQDVVKLIIMDMSMPIIDGPTAIKVIRQLNKSVPIFAASALSSLPSNLDMENENVQVVLRKPFVIEELLTNIAVALKKNS